MIDAEVLQYLIIVLIVYRTEFAREFYIILCGI
ncbi:unknown [Coraliomargarita sp. CAG:312]|nr:unknown [Coraliomargarita sp. CAG:312]